MEFTITQEEMDELVKAHKTARETPAFALSTKQALDGKDFASMAWDRLREIQERLAKKYGYDCTTTAIDPRSLTFEAEPLTKAK